MSQHYSDPGRANDPHALPDIEVFYADDLPPDENGFASPPGWYWWVCLPGCLPDSDPFGPYESEAAAVAAAQEDSR
jgi:hypothetical protein